MALRRLVLCQILLTLALLAGLIPIWANPPLVIPVQPDYGGDYDLFGGQNYLSPDDGLMLESLTASHGMTLLKRTEQAKERLQALLNPVAWNHLQAPIEMQKQLYLVLCWMAEADDAEADVEEVVQEICRRGQSQPSVADATLQEVLLYNFRTAQSLGVLGFQGQVKLAQGLTPVITHGPWENRHAHAIPILPPNRFPQIAHQLFNYEIFAGPLPRTSTTDLAPSQLEFARRLMDRGLLSADSLKNP
ncbi:MAG: hypothetical protein EB090_00370 [Verrucomicrobia bacterium]|nr:hypothetical protein [Verrucomicrobiota bacterium]